MYKIICGESTDVPEEDCNSRKLNVLPKWIEKFDPKYIFNADEMGYFLNVYQTKHKLLNMKNVSMVNIVKSVLP